MNSTLKGWLRLVRVPFLFSIPGDSAAGFILAAGCLTKAQLFPLFSLMLAGLFAGIAGMISHDLADLEKDCMEYPDRPIPSHAVNIRAAVVACGLSVLLALLFSAIGVATFCTCILLVACIFLYNFGRGKEWKRGVRGFLLMGMSRFLNVALGVAGAFDIFGKNHVHWVLFLYVGIFAVGVFLYTFGCFKSAEDKEKVLPERPGYRLILAGAIVSYALLFGIVIQKPTDNWFSLLSGSLSAISAAVFVVLAYWCFRLFHYAILPIQVRKSFDLQIFALMFLQAAALAAMGCPGGAGILIAGAVCSRIAAKYIYRS